jgi:hypothetical protein
MRDAIAQAGVPLDCKHHGLHKAADRMPAEASPRSWLCLPHATFAEADRYCGEAEQLGLPSKP